ncbi:MAG: hypothetical protein IME94_07935 [Proteobacteria bacterium]|nr:hypothetical protein [Pseudomonadota bacterium]
MNSTINTRLNKLEGNAPAVQCNENLAMSLANIVTIIAIYSKTVTPPPVTRELTHAREELNYILDAYK